MSAYEIPDRGATPQPAAADAQAVTVVHGSDAIGRGELVMTESRIDVTGSYQWPPDAPAEVRFVFTFQILSSSTCNVHVDWPGLLPKVIGPVEAGYLMLLLEARPQFLVFLPDGGTSPSPTWVPSATRRSSPRCRWRWADRTGSTRRCSTSATTTTPDRAASRSGRANEFAATTTRSPPSRTPTPGVTAAPGHATSQGEAGAGLALVHVPSSSSPDAVPAR